MSDTKRAVIYKRVSTNEQAKEGYSLDEQERKCRAAIESKGWTCTHVYEDAGISGGTMERKDLQAMIADIERGNVDVVVIWKLDRLSRRQRDTLTIIEDILMANDVALMSLNETLDTSTPWGRAMIGILSSFNQMELENIRERMTMGRNSKAHKGDYAGGRVPFGYKAVEKQLVIEPKEAEIVRFIYDQYAAQSTYKQIAAELTKRRYLGRSGKPISTSTIQSILNNERTYHGYYRYGKDGEWVKGQHEPILTGAYKDERRYAPILEEAAAELGIVG